MPPDQNYATFTIGLFSWKKERVPVMARRKDHTREELKALILDASWDLVGKEGAQGLSARRIATRIGYTPGTIYNIFESMDDLSLEVNARTLDALYAVLTDSACHDPRKTPLQNMKKMAALYREFAQEHRPHWLMLFLGALPDSRRTQKWYQEKINRLFDPLESLLHPFFPDHQAAKRQMAARILWSSVHGLCLLQETGKAPLIGKKSRIKDMTDYLIDTFVAGIRS